MKRIITFLCILSIYPLTNNAQSIINGDFETWQSMVISEPTGSVTANLDMLRHNGENITILVTKTTDAHAGLYACKAETQVVNSDTSFGYVVFGKSGDSGPEGGYPYTQKPDSIVGWYKSNINVSDSALVLVSFSLNGASVLQKMFFLKGTHSTYTRFSFPLNIPVGFACDTAMVGFASSDPFNDHTARPGSWVIMDDISFVGTGITQQIPNSNFELWSDLTFNKPAEWLNYYDANLNPSVSKTTDKYAGNYAAKITTIAQGNYIINATHNGYQTNAGPGGGNPFTLMADTLIGYYKYIPQGIDTAIVGVQLKKNGITLTWEFMMLYSASSYTQFSIPFHTMTAPDTIIIIIGASTWNATPSSVGSMLYIDEVQLKSQPLSTSIRQYNNIFSNMLYPNPAQGELNIDFTLNSPEETNIFIHDLSGKLISTTFIKANAGVNNKTIDINNLSKGMYTLTIQTNSKQIRTTKFIVK